MPRQTTKRLLKAQERFKTALTAYIRSLGSRPGSYYDHVLDTPAGRLNITIYGNWIATRFDNVAAGTAFTTSCGYSCNSHSGKWNFHYGDGSAASLDPSRVITQFAYYLNRLLTWRPAA